MKTHISARVEEHLATWLDSYQAANGLKSRSSALEEAIKALREKDLYRQYGQAFDEWEADTETKTLWDKTAADGLEDESETWRYLLERP